MNTGKTLFAQLLDFLPWSTFERIVARYHGDRSGRCPVHANTRLWRLPNSPIERACATSKPRCRLNLPSCTIWVCRLLFKKRSACPDSDPTMLCRRDIVSCTDGF